MSNQAGRVAGVCFLSVLVAALVQFNDPGNPWSALALLGGCVAIGDLLMLRPSGRWPLPLSFVFVMVLVRAANTAEFAIVIVSAFALLLVLRPADPLVGRFALTFSRLIGAACALAAYQLVLRAPADTAGVGVVMAALTLAGMVEIGIDDATWMIRKRHLSWTVDGRLADLALIASGVLMSVAYQGVGNANGMGLWAPLLFSIPLLAAWYAYERLDAIKRVHEQTIVALSVLPELAGLTIEGHAERVADLSVALGRELGVDRQDLDYLRNAALLHHIGYLCLDVSEGTDSLSSSEATEKGAEILRQAGYLAPVADLLAADGGGIGGQILRVASTYDELASGENSGAQGALDALYSGPGFVYDARLIDALERVVVHNSVPALS